VTVSTSARRDAGSPPAAAGAPRSVAAAIAAWHRRRGGKLVVVLDQVEAALGDDDFVRDVLGFAGWPAGADVSVVLSIREDHLARLLAPAQGLEPGIHVVRLPPLPIEGARAAIVGPLTEARLAIEPELLEVLLADLQRAAGAIGPELGWGSAPAVFPPHLQLACSALYEGLAPGDATLTLAHYTRLGGFDAIVGEHLERVLDTELVDGNDRIARALFVALVTATHERAMRPEAELFAMVGDANRAASVLEILRTRGLLVRVRGDGGEPSWELAHDSLVPRVRAWLDAHDLARRQAIELVRYHLRRSRAEAPSLLGLRELRELRRHNDAIVELDAEWQRRTTAEPWTPSRLVARSRRKLRRTIAVGAAALCALGVVAGVAIRRSLIDAEIRRLDLGRFALRLEPFDWDPVRQRATPADPARVPLRWELHAWQSQDDHGARFPAGELVRGTPRIERGALVEHVEARGGRAYLLISRGPCPASVVPVRDLPGYATREGPEVTLRVSVPTCAATRADTIEIPAGPFVHGGLGEPPSQVAVGEADPDERAGERIVIPGYRIDRTEVSNGAFAMFAAMVGITELAAPAYPAAPLLERAGEPHKPVAGIPWHVAHAYCRYLGKQLPTTQQWTKAMRGGERLPDGSPNPMPRRNLPWGTDDRDVWSRAQLYSERLGLIVGSADVGSHPKDVSPYGVLDLAGNVQEWTRTRGTDAGARIIRGGGVFEMGGYDLLHFMSIDNRRAELSVGLFELGMRCVLEE
jgi:hypothetical protein